MLKGNNDVSRLHCSLFRYFITNLHIILQIFSCKDCSRAFLRLPCVIWFAIPFILDSSYIARLEMCSRNLFEKAEETSSFLIQPKPLLDQQNRTSKANWFKHHLFSISLPNSI